MANIRTHLPDGNTFISFDGKTYHSTNMGKQLASPLDIATHQTLRLQIERWRDHG